MMQGTTIWNVRSMKNGAILPPVQEKSIMHPEREAVNIDDLVGLTRGQIRYLICRVLEFLVEDGIATPSDVRRLAELRAGTRRLAA